MEFVRGGGTFMFGKCINFIYPPICPLQLAFYKRIGLRHISKVRTPWWCCGAPILFYTHSKIGSGWNDTSPWETVPGTQYIGSRCGPQSMFGEMN